MKISELSGIQSILAVILYGSRARHDADEYSDIDVCVICDDIPFKEIEKVRNEVAQVMNVDIESISVYRMKEFKKMLSAGSLFAWHLRLEGRIIYSHELLRQNLFSNLHNYERAREDLLSYRELLEDIRTSVKGAGCANVFDLALMFTVIRNTCMVMCYCLGTPRFGRNNVFKTARSAYEEGFPIDAKIYEELSKWRLWYSRGVLASSTMPSVEEMLSIVDKTDRLISLALEEVR